MPLLTPRLLLRAEGASIFLAATIVYWREDHSWLLYFLLILAPDLSMLGYLGGNRIGSYTYNAAHTTVLPLALGLYGYLDDSSLALSLALIWLAHIGFDRLVGYGLKYPTEFRETHLARV
jgi:hypothetical protein